MNRILIAILAVFTIGLVAGCGEVQDRQKDQYKQIEKKAKQREAYIPQHDVELNNYNKAQKLYDSPTTIQWCTTTWANPSAPIITVPIVGKLTSSSTTFFSPEGLVFDIPGDGIGNSIVGPRRSVDGLYHPNPPQYRYGFTPGDQYADFFEMPTFCTTDMTKFQRESTSVTTELDPEAKRLTQEAEDLLKKGDPKAAQEKLKALGSTG
jgi:hypothetical protein